MKKILILFIFVLSALKGLGQTTPTNPVLIPVAPFYYEPSTHNRWVYNGPTLGWVQIVDSIQLKRNLSKYLPLTGGVITGNLTVNGNSTINGLLYGANLQTTNVPQFGNTTSAAIGADFQSAYSSGPVYNWHLRVVGTNPNQFFGLNYNGNYIWKATQGGILQDGAGNPFLTTVTGAKPIVAGANITINRGTLADTINATGGGGGSGTTTYPLNFGYGFTNMSSFNGGAAFNQKIDTTNIATRAYVLAHSSVGSSKIKAFSDYGAKADIVYTTGTISSASTSLTVVSTVTSADIGKIIVVRDANTSGTSLITTITGVTSTHVVTLAAPAALTVSNAYTVYGTDNTNAILSATAANAYITDNQDYLVSFYTNVGTIIDGPTRIFKLVQGGLFQMNSYADKYQHSLGQEYLSAFHGSLLNAQSLLALLSGDSTFERQPGGDVRFVPDALLSEYATKYGITGITWGNRGHSGHTIYDWLHTYLASDMAENPKLYLWHWGINSAQFSTPAQALAQVDSGLRYARVTLGKTYDVMSIVLMSPNSTSDTEHDRDGKWYEAFNQGLKALARKWQCTFYDTYADFNDSYNGYAYMDTPYVAFPNGHLHPNQTLNVVIYSKVAKLLFPEVLLTRLTTPGVPTLSANAIPFTDASGHLTADAGNISRTSGGNIVLTGEFAATNYTQSNRINLYPDVGGFPYIQGANAANTAVKVLGINTSGGDVRIGSPSYNIINLGPAQHYGENRFFAATGNTYTYINSGAGYANIGGYDAIANIGKPLAISQIGQFTGIGGYTSDPGTGHSVGILGNTYASGVTESAAGFLKTGFDNTSILRAGGGTLPIDPAGFSGSTASADLSTGVRSGLWIPQSNGQNFSFTNIPAGKWDYLVTIDDRTNSYTVLTINGATIPFYIGGVTNIAITHLPDGTYTYKSDYQKPLGAANDSITNATVVLDANGLPKAFYHGIGSSSQWVTTGSDIYYNTGKVYINQTGDDGSGTQLQVNGYIKGSQFYVGGNENIFYRPTGGVVGLTSSLRIGSLSTTGTPPATNGTTKMVVTDQDGLLSFSNSGYVDLTSNQNIAGFKSFTTSINSPTIVVNGGSSGLGFTANSTGVGGSLVNFSLAGTPSTGSSISIPVNRSSTLALTDRTLNYRTDLSANPANNAIGSKQDVYFGTDGVYIWTATNTVKRILYDPTF